MGSKASLLALLVALPMNGAAQETVSQPAPMTLSNSAAARLLLKQGKPPYPPVARVNYIQGPVDLEVVVSPTGTVEEAHVLRGEALLAAAALEAVRSWRYDPYIGPNGPTSFQARVRINFRLEIEKRAELPAHAASDLAHQVRRPRVIRRPAAASGEASVRLRALIGTDGRVLDAAPAEGSSADAPVSTGAFQGWEFQPARWGTLPIPWYLDVDVPAESHEANRNETAPTNP